MSDVHIACAQLTWRNMTEDEILGEIAPLGYEGSPPVIRGEQNDYNVSVPEIKERFERHGLVCAPPYFAGPFWDRTQQDYLLALAEHVARLAEALEVTELYVAVGGGGPQTPAGAERSMIAGHVRDNDAMPQELFEQAAKTISRVGAITLAHGVRSCFHNHVGTVIETANELDRLIELCDDTVFLGLDVGHLAWAGADPVATVAQYGDRVLTLHLKDVQDDVRRRGFAEKWDYPTFTANGIFTELGQGDVDFPAIKDLLIKRDFSGWLIVETDVTQQPTARQSAEISRRYLTSLGW